MTRFRLLRRFFLRLVAAVGLTFSAAAESVTFPEFDTGVITGGGAAVTTALDVSGMPAMDYNIISVTANFVPGPSPNDAYSQTIRMALTNADGSVSYWPLSGATMGVLTGGGTSAAGPTVLRWTGILPTDYAGGTPLTIRFSDTFNDASGPYTSELQDVSVTLHATPQPAHTFASFNTGPITGGGAAFTRSFSTAGLPDLEYFLFKVTADFVPGPSPNDAYSQTIQMELNNGGGTVHFPSSRANLGALAGPGATQLQWSGMLSPGYIGGDPLTIRILDTFNDASGPYTSQLNNVVVTIHPLPSPKRVFGPLTSGTITGGGAAVSIPLDTASLPATEYVHVHVAGTFNATNGTDAWSETMRMSLGGATEYRPFLKADSGFLSSSASTTLRWSGVLPRAYLGGDDLNLLFRDTFTDSSGPYTSTMSNVVVTLYPAYTRSAEIVSLERADATPANAATVNWSLVFDTEVTGVTAANFSLSPTVTGASVGTPTTGDSGLTWNIPVSTGTGDGTLGLNVANTTGWSISPSTGLPYAGQTYMIDKTAPTLAIGSPSASLTRSGPVTWQVTYADANFASASLAAGDLTLGSTGTATGTLAVSGSGTTRTVTLSDISGDGTLGISIAAGTGADTAGNTAPAAGPSVAVTVDNTPPVITSAAAGGGTFGAAFTYAITASGDAVEFGATGLPDGLSRSGDVISGTPAETGEFTVSLSATDAAGNIGTGTLVLDIAKAAASVTLGDLEQTYDGSPNPISALTSPEGLAVTFSYDGSAAAPTGAGSYQVVATISDDNYQGSATGTLAVTTVPLLVTADNITRPYGSPNPELTATITGFVNGEDLSVLGGAPELDTGVIATSPPGDYPITVTTGTLSADNYHFTTSGGTLTVRKRTVGDWNQEHFTPEELLDADLSGPFADADSDGAVNLVEFAFGTDPRDPATGPAPLEYAGDLGGNGTIVATGQTLLRFEPSGTGVDFRVLFIRLNPAFTETPGYAPEFSPDLAGWQASGATPTVLAEEGLYQVVSVPYPFFVNGKKARFHRLHILPLD